MCMHASMLLCVCIKHFTYDDNLHYQRSDLTPQRIERIERIDLHECLMHSVITGKNL
jgi:hypothetical protein